MKKILCFIYFGFLVSPLAAQGDLNVFKLVLKDGSLIIGQLKEKQEDKYVKILISETSIPGRNRVHNQNKGKLLTLPYVLIEEMNAVKSWDQILLEHGYVKIPKNIKREEDIVSEGWVILPQLAFSYGTFEGPYSSDWMSGIHVSILANDHYNHYLGIGGGLAADFQDYDPLTTLASIRFVADIRGYLYDHNFSPLYALSTGYNITTNPIKSEKRNKYTNGFFIIPRLGFKFFTKGKLDVFSALGYRFQYANSTQVTVNGEGTFIVDRSAVLRRLDLSFGLVLKL